MNKKGIWDDLVDIAWTAAIVIIAIFLFSTFLQSSKTDIEDKVNDKDALIERESAMINFLRTPVKLIIPEDIADETILVQDLVSASVKDPNAILLLGKIAESEEFKKYSTKIHYEFWPKPVELYRGCNKGKSSIAYIPTIYSDKIEPLKLEFRYCP